MKTKVEKWLKYLAAGAFLLALIINVKVTLDDPFVLMSDAAIAQTTTTTTTSSSSSTPPPFGLPECPGSITCGSDICIVTNHKNRFMARGCIAKCGYTCTCQKIDLGISL